MSAGWEDQAIELRIVDPHLESVAWQRKATVGRGSVSTDLPIRSSRRPRRTFASARVKSGEQRRSISLSSASIRSVAISEAPLTWPKLRFARRASPAKTHGKPRANHEKTQIVGQR